MLRTFSIRLVVSLVLTALPLQALLAVPAVCEATLVLDAAGSAGCCGETCFCPVEACECHFQPRPPVPKSAPTAMFTAPTPPPDDSASIVAVYPALPGVRLDATSSPVPRHAPPEVQRGSNRSLEFLCSYLI